VGVNIASDRPEQDDLGVRRLGLHAGDLIAHAVQRALRVEDAEIVGKAAAILDPGDLDRLARGGELALESEPLAPPRIHEREIGLHLSEGAKDRASIGCDGFGGACARFGGAGAVAAEVEQWAGEARSGRGAKRISGEQVAQSGGDEAERGGDRQPRIAGADGGGGVRVRSRDARQPSGDVGAALEQDRRNGGGGRSKRGVAATAPASLSISAGGRPVSVASAAIRPDRSAWTAGTEEAASARSVSALIRSMPGARPTRTRSEAIETLSRADRTFSFAIASRAEAARAATKFRATSVTRLRRTAAASNPAASMRAAAARRSAASRPNRSASQLPRCRPRRGCARDRSGPLPRRRSGRRLEAEFLGRGAVVGDPGRAVERRQALRLVGTKAGAGKLDAGDGSGKIGRTR
jgi:hypothetical protein